MANDQNQQNQTGNSATNNTTAYTKAGGSNRIPANASAEQASEILGYGVGDTVILGDTVTSDLSSGGTSADNTPNSTNAPGMAKTGSDMANINAGHSSGNSARKQTDSHQASMSNAAPGQRFLVNRYDDVKGLFYAYKLNDDGTHDNTEVPLAPDENYQVAGE